MVCRDFYVGISIRCTCGLIVCVSKYFFLASRESQRILTVDGYIIPINIVGGLPYISLRPYTDEEWDQLPHIILTSDLDWNPTALDHTIDDDNRWYDAMCDMD